MMMKIAMVLLLLLDLAPFLVHSHSATSLAMEHWHTHRTALLYPVSDHSATLVLDTGKVYLVGGCNNTNGNVRITIPSSNGTTDDDEQFFTCPEVTRAGQVFDIRAATIESIPDAPRERYRHSAVWHQGLIWLLGGRDGADGLVVTVDIFDTTTGAWRTDLSFQLPNEMARSDQAAFVIEDTIYLAGGYASNYTATADTFAIDIPQSLASQTDLVWSKKASLNQERGDCYAAVVGTDMAYIVGGFTHRDNWCKALDAVERYSPDGDVWIQQDELTYARADKAMVTIGTKIYVIGGESKTDCAGDPGQRTNPTTEVEVLNTADPTGIWTEEIADVPDDQFRFPAVAYDGVIYTFGGQKYYNSDCDCFPLTFKIMTFDTDADYGTSGTPLHSMVVTTLSVALFLLALFF